MPGTDAGGQERSDPGIDPATEAILDAADNEPTDSVQRTEKPEVTDEHREKAKEMAKEYEDDRPTVTLPGSDGTVSGTAVADWTDKDGNKIASEDKAKDEG